MKISIHMISYNDFVYIQMFLIKTLKNKNTFFSQKNRDILQLCVQLHLCMLIRSTNEQVAAVMWAWGHIAPSPKLPLSLGDWVPSKTWFIAFTEFPSQIAPRSVQLFLQGSRFSPTDRQTDRQTDRPCYNCSNSHVLCHARTAMWPKIPGLYCEIYYRPTHGCGHVQYQSTRAVYFVLTL